MYAQSRKVGKPNNFRNFGSKETKGPSHDRQNRLRSHMPEGGEP